MAEKPKNGQKKLSQLDIDSLHMHRTGKRRDIDPCGTCNNFWPSFRSLSTIDAVRTGIEYCSYVARHRPTGVKRPLNGKKERIPVTSLVTLRRRDDL